MVGTGILHKQKALGGGIGLAQGGPYGFAIIERDQRIIRAEDTGKP